MVNNFLSIKFESFLLSNLINKDLEESEQFNSNNDKEIRKSSISYVLNNPYLEELNKIDEVESESEEDEFKSKNDFKQKSNSNKKKQQQIALNVRKNSNRTFQKYQINKSNSIQEAENSLQRLNGKLNDKKKLIINKNLINFFLFY